MDKSLDDHLSRLSLGEWLIHPPGPDSEGSTPRYDSHCEEDPVSRDLTTGTLGPAPDTGRPLFFLFLFFFIVYTGLILKNQKPLRTVLLTS